LELWQTFYSWHDPVIFTIGKVSLRWYGFMYVTALLTGYLWGRKMILRGDWRGITLAEFETLFFWFVIGAVLGARLGYVFVYDDHRFYFLSHPWEIFNPFQNEAIGISGLSYHGAIIGAIVALRLFAKKRGFKLLFLLDLAAVSGSAGYFFGRVGNFLNVELIGRETSMPWGVLYEGVLRHPSALYEAFLEGICVFLALLFLYKRRKFDGQMMCLYAIFYTIARFIAEFFREPDSQLGFFGVFTMGQILSAVLFAATLSVYFILRRQNEFRQNR
jgi:phosphatidylglycerol:prolipoprotein diacylglycerol transferase